MAITMQVNQDSPVRGSREQRPYGAETLLMETTHVGMVVALRERNFHDDSDFYAVVYNGSSFEEVMYATTRGWTYANGAAVDASPELMQKYQATLERSAAEELARQKAIEDATPRKGKQVVVVKGRKLAHGTEGEVFWYGKSKFGGYSVGMILRDGSKVFTNAQNVKVKEEAVNVQDALDDFNYVGSRHHY